MSKTEIPLLEDEKISERFDHGEFQIVDGELLETGGAVNPAVSDEELTKISVSGKKRKVPNQKQKTGSQIQYLVLPVVFLAVVLFGGLRFASPGNDFLFVKPALICLIFAVALLFLFFRARLILLDGWFSEDFPLLKNLANGGILLALFFASVQIFNSLIPENGLPFWVISFCFVWTLWMNLFSNFDAPKLIKSVGALFVAAFLTKYLLLGYLTAPTSEGFWRGILQNPTQEFFTWLFELPRYSAATGYLQFFAVILYLLGLYLLPAASVRQID